MEALYICVGGIRDLSCRANVAVNTGSEPCLTFRLMYGHVKEPQAPQTGCSIRSRLGLRFGTREFCSRGGWESPLREACRTFNEAALLGSGRQGQG